MADTFTVPDGWEEVASPAMATAIPDGWEEIDRKTALQELRRQDAATAVSSIPSVIREPLHALAGAGANIMSTVARPFSKDVADYFAETGQQIDTRAEATRKDDWSPWLSRMYGGAVESLAQSTVAAPAGPAGIIGSFALTEGNQALYDAEQAGLKGSDRIKYAVTQGVIEGAIAGVFQRFAPGLEKFIPKIASGAMKLNGAQFVKMAAQELPEEVITEVGHAVTEAAYGIDPEALSSEKFGQRMIDTVAQTVATLGLAQASAKLMQKRQEGASEAAPAAPGNSVEDTERQLEQLREIRDKGFVTAEEAQTLGLSSEEAKSRRSRMAAVKLAEREAERELERAQRRASETAPEAPAEQAPAAPPEAAPAAPEEPPPAPPSSRDDAKQKAVGLAELMAKKRAEATPEPASAPPAPTPPQESPAAPEPVPLSPREKAQQGRKPEPRMKPPSDEAEAAAQVEAIRRENKQKRFGRKDQAETAPAAPPQATEATTAKEPWQETADDYSRRLVDLHVASNVKRRKSGLKDILSDKQTATMWRNAAGPSHKFYVKEALAAGKPVPPEVLADYPDLASKAHAQPQNASAAETGPTVVPTTETLPEAVQEPEAPRKREKPEFRDWRFVPGAQNSGKIVPNRVGRKFTDEQVKSLTAWAKAEGLEVVGASGTGFKVVGKPGDRLDLSLSGAVGVKREQAEAKSQAGKQETERKREALEQQASGRKSSSWIADTFGDAMNAYNRNALADFVEGGTPKFGGVVSPQWREGLEKIGATNEQGSIDWKKVKAAYENAAAVSKPPSVTDSNTISETPPESGSGKDSEAAAKPKRGRKVKPGDTRKDEFGVEQVYRMVDPNTVGFTEPTDVAEIEASVEEYTRLAESGSVPPPVDIVWSEQDGRPVTSNRRRVMAAQRAGTLVPAWVDRKADSNLFPSKPKSLRKSKKSKDPQTLLQAVQEIGGLDPKKMRKDVDREDMRGLLGAFKNKGGGYAVHGLDTMATALESAGYWRAPEGSNAADALWEALKAGEKTIQGNENANAIEADYAAHLAKQAELEQEMTDVEQAGVTRQEAEEAVRAGARAGLVEAEADEGEAAEVIGGDDSFDFGMNDEWAADAGVAGEQQELFKDKSAGNLFNVGPARKKWKKERQGPSEMERREAERREEHIESAPGQKTMLQQSAEDALKDAQDEAAKLRKKLGGEKLFSNPMLDPEIIAQSGKVVYAYSKAGILKFAAFTEQLASDIGQSFVDDLLPVLKSEWNKLHATGEFKGMTDADGNNPVKPPAAEAPAPKAASDDTTGTKHAKTDELRAKTGMEERPPVEPESREEWEVEAARRIAADPDYAPKLAAKLVAKPQPIDKIENAVLGQHIQDLENRRKAGEDVLKELATAAEAVERGGSETGRALASRKAERFEDYSLAGIVSQHVQSVNATPTAEQMQKYAELADRVQELEEELNETNYKLAQAEIDKQIAEAKAAPPAAPQKKGTKRQRLQQTASEAVSAFKTKWATLNQVGAVSDPKQSADQWIDITKAAGDVVKAYADLGVDSFLELMARVKKDLGTITARQRQAFREAWGTREPPESTADRATIGEVARKLTRFAVESGITEREEVIDAVHEELTSQGFEVSRSETMAAMAARGAYRMPSNKEVNAKIRGIKNEIRRLLKTTDPTKEAAKKVEQYKKSLDRRLVMWESIRDDAARGKLPEKRKPTPADKEVLEKKFQIEQAKRRARVEIETAALAARSKTGKVVGFAGDLLDLAQLIQTGYELSAVLRQGLFYTLGHPRKAFPAILSSARAVVSRRADFAIHDDLLNRPNHAEYVRGGLETTVDDGPLSQREELLRSRIASWLSTTEGAAWALPRWAAEGVLGGERAFRSFSNTMRADLFDYMKSSVDSSRPGTWSEDDAKRVAFAANVFSGRGQLPGKLTGVSSARIFFAPRWVWSRGQVLAGQPLWKGDRATRLAVGKVYVRAALGVAAYQLLQHLMYALLADDDEHEPKYELDMRSSDFSKMRIGETRIDTGAGLAQLLILAARLKTGETKRASGEIVPIRGDDVPYGADDTRDVLHRFLNSKLAPLPSGVLDWIAGENIVGEKATVGSIVGERVTPMTWRDIWAAEKELNVPQGTVAAIQAFFGASVTTYGPRSEFRDTDEAGRKEIIETDLENRSWSDPEKPEYAEFLTEDQLQAFRERRSERRTGVLIAATYDGDNEKELKTRDKNIGFLREMKAEGVSLAEAEQLLKAHYYEPTEKEVEKAKRENREPRRSPITAGERPGYNAKLLKLRTLYGE